MPASALYWRSVEVILSLNQRPYQASLATITVTIQLCHEVGEMKLFTVEGRNGALATLTSKHVTIVWLIQGDRNRDQRS